MPRLMLFGVRQVLGLWMVVVDSQVELVITQHLNNDNQNLLKSLPLRYSTLYLSHTPYLSLSLTSIHALHGGVGDHTASQQ